MGRPSPSSVRTCASGLEPPPLRLPRHLIFLPFSLPSLLRIHLAPFSAFLLHLPIFLSPISPISFSPSPPLPLPNSAPLCLSALSSLPSLSFLLLRRGCDHRNILGAEEGAELGRDCRGAVPSMAALAAAGNKVAGSSRSWVQELAHPAGQGFRSHLLPITADDLDKSFTSVYPRVMPFIP